MVGISSSLARWITAPGPDPQNPLLRLGLDLPAPPVSATWLVTGLGTFRAHVNGVEVGEGRLEPGLTDPRSRVQVVELEIATLLHRGENVLGIELGRGFHTMTTPNEWRWHEAPWRSPVRAWALLRLHLADGSSRAVATGEDWRTRPGPVTFDSMYEGETFAPTEDPAAWTRPGYDAADWEPVLVARTSRSARRRAELPEPVMQRRVQEPVVEQDEIVPELVSSTLTRAVLDMGRVIAGWCEFSLADDVPADAPPLELVARHAEKLREDGRVDAANPHVHTDRFQEDRVLLHPAYARSFAPRHSYKGFRYVEVEAAPGDLARLRVTGFLAHADLRAASTLTSADPYLQRFDAAMRASLLNNMHHVPTDSPSQEKNGWTGDALTALAAMTTSFDMRRMLRKWLDDQVDAQRPDGSLAVISPSPGWGYEELSPAPEWTCLLPMLLEEMVVEHGEADLVARHAPAAGRYLAHELGRRDGDGLIGGVLGDYLSPGSPGPAPEDRRLSATLHVARALRALAHALELAGEEPAADGSALLDPAGLRAEAEALERAVNTVFLDPERGLYRDPDPDSPGSRAYRQTSNILPLAFDVVPAEHVDAVVAHLVEDIEARGDHHDCGHLGVRHLLPVLSRHGHGALALRVLENPTAPGWRAWLEAGNATLAEKWEDPRSHSHYFMGTPVTWIHEHALGLQRGRDGWQEFRVAPDPDVPVGRLTMTRRTDLGEIVLKVDRDARTLSLTVPDGTSAQVLLPGLERDLGPGEHVLTW
ncbi:family 78 glycoside hydrolase catalytic domain [Brachybacterium aquaticum]|uniref:alpha-L-rhamnosidase n=1 Tax=Brachybacterium aquaticum TaxID=1432564 RepID=A0A841AGG8_9MICO|nr:family 78 glycoside hydrolase catalytic domain [Brachybacterium aquaticum]MBB5832362.1 alpha-L-rhamnosidase [Brachybacterium aquaticum]